MRQILFFDGHCNLCNGFVDFLLRRDKKHKFHFASLQGKTAESLVDKEFRESLFTFVLLLEEDKKVLTKSTAVLKVCSQMNFPWSLMIVFKVVPQFVRDKIYDLVSSKRYQWFGRRDSCRVPEPSEKDYLLD